MPELVAYCLTCSFSHASHHCGHASSPPIAVYTVTHICNIHLYVMLTIEWSTDKHPLKQSSLTEQPQHWAQLWTHETPGQWEHSGLSQRCPNPKKIILKLILNMHVCHHHFCLQRNLSTHQNMDFLISYTYAHIAASFHVVLCSTHMCYTQGSEDKGKPHWPAATGYHQ